MYSCARPCDAGRYVGSRRSACWYACRAVSRIWFCSSGASPRLEASSAANLPYSQHMRGVGCFLGRSLSFLTSDAETWAACVGVVIGVAAVDGVLFVPVVVQPARPPSRASGQNTRLRQSIVVPPF